MTWVPGNKWYIATDCGRYTVGGDKRQNGEIRYSAWRCVKPSPKGHPFNPPISLGMQFETADAAKQACVDDAAVTEQVAA